MQRTHFDDGLEIRSSVLVRRAPSPGSSHGSELEDGAVSPKQTAPRPDSAFVCPKGRGKPQLCGEEEHRSLADVVADVTSRVGASINGATPIAGWFRRENPI